MALFIQLFAGEPQVGGLVVIDGAAQLGAKGVIIERFDDIGILVHDHPDTAQVVVQVKLFYYI
jgi:hypothetical protein